jgi:DNA-binding CsgD family transcriptional regulator
VHLGLVTLIVDDGAARLSVGALDYELVEDSPASTRPRGREAAGGRATAARGDRCVPTRSDEEDPRERSATGCGACRLPRDEPNGRVAVLEDVAGDRWDLIARHPGADGRDARAAAPHPRRDGAVDGAVGQTGAVTEVQCPVTVGRAHELAALRAALERALAGRGGCVSITGEAGIGKSRLVRELTGMAADRGVTVIGGRAVPASSATAYRPLTGALLQLLRRVPLSDDPSLAPWLPHLAAVLPGVAAGAPPVRAGEAAGADASGADAVRGEAVLQLLGHSGPDGLVLTLEDLHWADPDTVTLLDYLTDNVGGLPLLLVVSLRTEPASAAADLVRRQRGRAGVVHLPLGRLAEPEVTDMITACRPDADADARARILEVSDGVPLLIEELLASPGVPASVTDTVRVRLAELADDERAVLESAAVIGRHFDWDLLPAASGTDPDVVSRALSGAAERGLVDADGAGFRFRHALIREAVLASMLPQRVRRASREALAAVDAAHPYLEGAWREVAADLALQAEETARAGRLLADAGRRSVEVGALATAVDTLRRAVELLDETRERAGAELALLQALALAGRVDEAAGRATELVWKLGDDPAFDDVRVEAHLLLAQAAVAASRWPLARDHVAAAVAHLDATDPRPAARAAVLAAELALAGGDAAGAGEAAGEVLAMEGASPDARCHAYEIVGRTRRLHDLDGAATAFEAALATAVRHDLPVWRMRALHELGTVDAFDRVDVDRLVEARRLGAQMGALSTVAVLDLQLAACFTMRWDLDACDAHASSALVLARRLRLGKVAAKALGLMAGSASMRADLGATERRGEEAMRADPADRMLAGFCRASVGMALFMAGDVRAALDPFAEGTAVLSGLPDTEPISIRALWPLIQAAEGDPRAAATLDEVRRLGVDAIRVNRGITGYARAVLEGRSGRPGRADAIVAGLATTFLNCGAWADLVRFIAAPHALADGWGDPGRWLDGAGGRFTALGLDRLARRCAELRRGSPPNPWASEGYTGREADVLRLVIGGLANKEIAAALGVSPRTVEKHVESLLRKAGARSRTELAVTAGRRTT